MTSLEFILSKQLICIDEVGFTKLSVQEYCRETGTIYEIQL